MEVVGRYNRSCVESMVAIECRVRALGWCWKQTGYLYLSNDGHGASVVEARCRARLQYGRKEQALIGNGTLKISTVSPGSHKQLVLLFHQRFMRPNR